MILAAAADAINTIDMPLGIGARRENPSRDSAGLDRIPPLTEIQFNVLCDILNFYSRRTCSKIAPVYRIDGGEKNLNRRVLCIEYSLSIQ